MPVRRFTYTLLLAAALYAVGGSVHVQLARACPLGPVPAPADTTSSSDAPATAQEECWYPDVTVTFPVNGQTTITVTAPTTVYVRYTITGGKPGTSCTKQRSWSGNITLDGNGNASSSDPVSIPSAGTYNFDVGSCVAVSGYGSGGAQLTATSANPPPPPPSSGANPKGYLDVIVNGAVGAFAYGWTCDPDNFGQPLTAAFYTGGPPGGANWTKIGEITANAPREPAVGAECGGNSNRGFQFPIPGYLLDGKPHDLYAYGINIGGGSNTLLKNSPMSFTFGGTPGGCTNNAAFGQLSTSANMVTGQPAQVFVEMQNPGTCTWTSGAGYQLSSISMTNWGVSAVPVSSAVGPGGSAQFIFNVTPPAVAGSYILQFQMNKSGNLFGSTTPAMTITVEQDPFAAPTADTSVSIESIVFSSVPNLSQCINNCVGSKCFIGTTGVGSKVHSGSWRLVHRFHFCDNGTIITDWWGDTLSEDVTGWFNEGSVTGPDFVAGCVGCTVMRTFNKGNFHWHVPLLGFDHSGNADFTDKIYPPAQIKVPAWHIRGG